MIDRPRPAHVALSIGRVRGRTVEARCRMGGGADRPQVLVLAVFAGQRGHFISTRRETLHRHAADAASRARDEHTAASRPQTVPLELDD